MATDDGFHSQSEIDGRAVLTSGDATLAVGFMAVVDPAAAITGTTGRGDRTIEFTNDSSTGGWIDTFTLTSQGQGSLSAIGVRTTDLRGTPAVQFSVDRTGAFGLLTGDDQRFRYLAMSFEQETLRGVSEGVVNLSADADAQVNFGTLFAPGETVTLRLAPRNRRVLALCQNDQVDGQFEVLRLSPGHGRGGR